MPPVPRFRIHLPALQRLRKMKAFGSSAGLPRHDLVLLLFYISFPAISEISSSTLQNRMDSLLPAHCTVQTQTAPDDFYNGKRFFQQTAVHTSDTLDQKHRPYIGAAVPVELHFFLLHCIPGKVYEPRSVPDASTHPVLHSICILRITP